MGSEMCIRDRDVGVHSQTADPKRRSDDEGAGGELPERRAAVFGPSLIHI